MYLKYNLLFLAILPFVTICIKAEVNNNQPLYSQTEKQKNIEKLRELANKTQTETINSSGNYNKAMFDAARQGYGGYLNINVEFDENDKGLSNSEKRSIENTRRNAEIMKEQLKGLK